MAVEIISRKGDELTLQVKIDISGSMLEAEEKIQAACNAVGSLSTEKALEYFDTDGTPVIIGEKKIHGKNERE
jgi:hypothetical protein